MNCVNSLVIALLSFLILSSCLTRESDRRQPSRSEPAAYWKLAGDTRDYSKNKAPAHVHGSLSFDNFETPDGKEAALFDGESAWIEVPATRQLQLGEKDFSISVWVHTDAIMNDFPGDIISQYDLKKRKGFHLSLKSNTSPTSLSSYKQLIFGIDDAQSTSWIDEGRPGNAILGYGMAEYKGELYVGVCQVSASESGKVFKYAAKNRWIDCGAPDQSNTVTALAVMDDTLYAATGHYRTGGSSLPDSENTIPGGKVFRFEAPDRWIEIGQLPGVEAVGSLMVYNGELYATSLYAPAGFFRYDGDNNWVKLHNPPGIRIVTLGVHDGYLYATSYDKGNVYRYNGGEWEDCGRVGENTQNYDFNIYEGNLYSSTWPSGRVYRFDGINKWSDMGRLGNELEVMAIITYNGQMLGGTLPLAEVYVYEGDTLWTRVDQLDRTPAVKYRRVWTMAEHDGKVFCSTLPSGKIFSHESGKSVAMAGSLKEGWQHITAVKTKQDLKLYVNGEIVNQTNIPDSVKFNLNNEVPFKIGFGANDYFSGRVRELRLYKRALSDKEIRTLSSIK